jgi:hypothetical protein
MAFSVRIDLGQPRLDSFEIYGRREPQYIVVEEAQHRLEITGNGPELTEVLQRLQGLPGIPDMNTVSVTYPSLDPNFARKLDL